MDDSPISPATQSAQGPACGAVRTVIRMEAVGVLLVAVLAYADTGNSWLTFALWFFVPDAALIGYAAGPRIGAASYNALHSYVGPVVLYLISTPLSHIEWLCLIWAAHIAFDRSLGYGLKYARGFSYTHLGPIGRREHVSAA